MWGGWSQGKVFGAEIMSLRSLLLCLPYPRLLMISYHIYTFSAYQGASTHSVFQMFLKLKAGVDYNGRVLLLLYFHSILVSEKLNV
ncbi:hypothetical protein GDO81_010222 [Engystomops pustulosus]|uniref:Uncharacterized protein n=1 Tax=Engystomops pustulosus TaxID=76066 RepID=A0AAV7BXW7_ENGPU|nr:hypothetical protein GDO81_010222 [Engystomops pustulosus]